MKIKIIKAIEIFESAVRVDENKGGGHPNDYLLKEQEYKIAKKRLIDTIDRHLPEGAK